MGKIDTAEFGNERPKLTPDDLDGDVALVTISEAETLNVNDPEAPSGTRKSLVLHFEESGDKSLWLNKSQIETLVVMLGDDTDDWMGKVIPVEVADVPYNGKTFRKVRVQAASEWQATFKEAGEKYPYRAVAPKSEKPAPRGVAKSAKPGRGRSR